jgi:predicted naringenin-chalcone synthase
MSIANNKGVYIANIQTILPAIYESHSVLKSVYCRGEAGISEAFADKIVSRVNIKYRPLIIDPDALPVKRLLKPEYSSLQWGVELINKLCHVIDKEEVGFFGLAYNVSSVVNSLPNLSSQIINLNPLKLDVPPEEKIYYGCASGILVLERAVEYCQKYNKAAIVYVFDQCSWAANIVTEKKNPEFKNSFMNSLIFGDGGVGVLVVPSDMKNRFTSNLLEIKTIQNVFEPFDTMHFDETGIQLDSKIHEVIPLLAVEKVVNPLLKLHNLKVEDIKEWSIHQGGIPILEQFTQKSILGLSEEQIVPSRELYFQYGNLSSASTFFVLNKHFKNNGNKGSLGIALSFGAGFYLGGFLYEKH